MTSSNHDKTDTTFFSQDLTPFQWTLVQIHQAANIDAICKTILDAMERLFGYKYCLIGLKDKNTLKIKHHQGFKPFPEDLSPLQLNKEAASTKAVKKKKAIVINDMKTHPDYLTISSAINSELAVPIQTKDRVIGVINIESTKKDRFTEREKLQIEIIAFHGALAITHLQKKKEEKTKKNALKTRIERLLMLQKWTNSLQKANNLETIYENVLDAIEEIFSVQYIILARKKSESLEIVSYSGYQPFPEELLKLPLDKKGIPIKVANTGEPILSNNVREHPEYLTISSAINSELAVPIQTKDRVIGVINIESTKEDRFTKRDQKLLELLASQIADVIQRVREREKRVSLQRLEAFQDQFLAMAAHEFNTPLSIIKMKTEMLLKDYFKGELSKKQKEGLKSIQNNIERLTEIVNDFRRIQRISKIWGEHKKVEKTKCFLPNLLEQVLKKYQTIIVEKNIHVVKNTQQPIHIRCNKKLMLQLLQNLIENAIDYTEDAVWIRSWKNNNVYISVRDDGPGIPETEQDKIFQPFYRVEQDRNRSHRQFGGTGLGLHICKRIVEAHQGSIDVTSAPGEGSTFTVILPSNVENDENSS